MKDLPSERRARVYVALEANGLASVCKDSERSEVLEAAGADSVHMCPPGAENAQLKVTFEQSWPIIGCVLVFHPNLMRAYVQTPNGRPYQRCRRAGSYLSRAGPSAG
jgi:iron complex transport system substrate-binding protein